MWIGHHSQLSKYSHIMHMLVNCIYSKHEAMVILILLLSGSSRVKTLTKTISSSNISA